MKRRQFLKTMTITAGAPVAASYLLGSLPAAEPGQAPKTTDTVRGDMRYRTLGRTGEQVSLIGLGGYHIGSPKDEQEGIRIIRSAIDHGINFMDNCWDYHNGGSEIRMGKALRDGYRQKVFLMTKIDGRTKQSAAPAARRIFETSADRSH